MSHAKARRIAGAVVITLLLASCTGGATDTTTTATTSTTLASSATTETPTTTTTGGPTTTSGPTTTTTTLAPPVLADPFVVASDALREVSGFSYVDDLLSPAEENELEFRLGALLGPVIAEYSWSKITSDTGVDLLVVSLVPASGYLGDPELDFGVAFNASDFADPMPRDIDEFRGWSLELAGRTWTFVGDNTHVFVVIGPEPEASLLLSGLLQANGPSYLWAAGDCLYFEDGAVPYAPFGEANLVECDDTHTHEVIWSVDTGEPFDAAYAGDDLADASFEGCEVAYEDYVGVPEFPSTVALIRYLPDVEEWAEGDRYLACVVYAADAAGAPVARRDALKGIGDDAVVAITPGDCWDIVGGSAIRCARPHAFEYLGDVDLEVEGADYPGASVIEAGAALACERLLGDIASDTVVEGAELEGFPAYVPGPAAWERGVRRAHCVAWAFERGGDPLLIIGSIAGDWEPVTPPRDGGLQA